MSSLAPSLVRCRTIIDSRWPNRDKASDGWIGDAAHQATTSDHNPNGRGIVNALDIDKDGIHVPTVLAALMTHPATNYVIHNRRIYQASDRFRPRVYTGSNPHESHVHESIRQSSSAEQDPSPWPLLAGLPSWPAVMRLGASGLPVRELQAYLNAYGASLVVDGSWGPLTDTAVRSFQRRYAVRNSVRDGQGDGIVGPFTRVALASS